MDFAALKAFLTVVEEGSFSKASEKLSRTQPAISLAVRRLEDELGERLIDRSSRELLLTAFGEVAYDFGKRFVGLSRDMVTAIEDLRNLAAGILRIGANESSTLYLLQHLIRFRQLYSGIRVRVQRCRSSQIPEQLLRGELEMGVISYEPGRKELACKVIYTDHLAFIVSPQHHLAGRRSVSIQKLGNETFIAHNVVSPYRERVIQTFQKHRVALQMEVEMPTVESIRKLVARNEGVAFLPRMCVDQEISQGDICEVKVPEMKLQRKIRLIYPRQRSLSRAAQAFLELVSQKEPKGNLKPRASHLK